MNELMLEERPDLIQLSRQEAALPTKARPGSEEKIRVLESRASYRMPLWVGGDCTNLVALLRRVCRGRRADRA